MRINGEGHRFFAPWSSDEDVNYFRCNSYDPRYFSPRSSDEEESYFRVNGEWSLYFAPWSSDEDGSFLKVISDGRCFAMLSRDEFVISLVLIELMSY